MRAQPLFSSNESVPCCCRFVSCYRNKFEEPGSFVQRFGNLSFPQFAQMVIAESEQYAKLDIHKVNVHWRPYYLSPCGFCDVSFKGKYQQQFTTSLPPKLLELEQIHIFRRSLNIYIALITEKNLDHWEHLTVDTNTKLIKYDQLLPRQRNSTMIWNSLDKWPTLALQLL